MQLLKTILVATPLFCVSMTTTAQQLKTEKLTGNWYVKGLTEDNKSRQVMVRRMNDQTYAAITLVCTGTNLISVQKENGTWTFANNTLVNTPQTLEDLTGKKQVEPGTKVTFSNVDLDDTSLSYQDDMQTMHSFQSVPSDFKIGCKAM